MFIFCCTRTCIWSSGEYFSFLSLKFSRLKISACQKAELVNNPLRSDFIKKAAQLLLYQLLIENLSIENLNFWFLDVEKVCHFLCTIQKLLSSHGNEIAVLKQGSCAVLQSLIFIFEK